METTISEIKITKNEISERLDIAKEKTERLKDWWPWIHSNRNYSNKTQTKNLKWTISCERTISGILEFPEGEERKI